MAETFVVRSTPIGEHLPPCPPPPAHPTTQYSVAIYIHSLFFTPSTECTGSNVSIIVTSYDKEVDAGSSVHMVCVAHGDPAPSIGWELDGQQITTCTSERVSRTGSALL